MGVNFRNTVDASDGLNPGNVLTLELGTVGAAPVPRIIHDSLTSVTTLNGDHVFTEESVGPSVLAVVAAAGMAVGTRYWIWDTTTYLYESFVVASIAGNNVTTTNESGLSQSYGTGAVISSTGPIDDAYRCVLSGGGQAGQTYAVLMGNEDPSATVYADLFAVPPYNPDFVIIQKAEANTNRLDADYPVTQGVDACRYLVILCDVDFVGTGFNEFVSAQVYRKRATSDQYVVFNIP